jgi:hypothetical protein
MGTNDERAHTHPPVEIWKVGLLLAFPYALVGLFIALSRTDSTAMYSGASLLTFIGQVIGWPIVLLG